MSKLHLSPYINFQGRARDAMTFYHEVLGGKLDLQTMNAQGATEPAGPGDRIAYARLEADGAVIVASDGHPDYPAKVGENMAITLGGTDRARLNTIFDKLGEGGTVQMPLTRQPGGTEVGWLRDRFGISWTVNVEAA